VILPLAYNYLNHLGHYANLTNEDIYLVMYEYSYHAIFYHPVWNQFYFNTQEESGISVRSLADLRTSM
jgi:hypothetical protein